ncbi:ABC transporter ATP-binding protein [Salinarimonas sp.]|uniref:ABC transporter ATP-binding protein n=1 Tax=Salinarimonas sp. TaxID=2766526 RepID=UPI00391CECF0
MAQEALTMRGVSVRLGGAAILDRVDLEAAPGTFLCLVGPSGCGKTTLLRAIAGFAPLASGSIAIGGRRLDDLPPERRGTAMVFQSYALWPHMSVHDNIAYPLRLRGVPRAARARRVDEILALLDLPGFGERRVDSLSGGQRQRVALGRALAVDPPVLLLDEPLSNLDAAIRRSLRAELRRLQNRLGITTLMVTHDQEEALALADAIAVMRAGRIVQIAAPDALYRRPADIETARFLGIDNVVAARPEDGVAAARIGFRSREARVTEADVPGALVRSGRVADCAYVGGAWHLALVCGDETIVAASERPHEIGTTAQAVVPRSALVPFGPDERLLACAMQARSDEPMPIRPREGSLP